MDGWYTIYNIDFQYFIIVYQKNQKSLSISEKLYSQANAANGATGNAEGSTEGPKADENGNVYNADYKVEEDKKDENK